MLDTLCMKKFFLMSNINLPCHNLRLFPHTLSPEKRDQCSPLCSLFRYLLSMMRSLLTLLFSRINNSDSLSCSSYVLFSSPFTGFIALFWTCSSNSVSVLYWGAPNCAAYKGKISSLVLLDTLFMIQADSSSEQTVFCFFFLNSLFFFYSCKCTSYFYSQRRATI